MSEITEAIKTRQTQITQLRSDIETLQRAAGVLGGKTKGQPKARSKPKRRKKAPKAKPTQPKALAKPKPQSTPKPKPKAKKRHQWSAAEKAAIGKRMKAYWAKRRKSSAPAAASPAQPTATQKRTRKPMSAAAKKAISKRMKAYWARRRKAKR